MDEAQLATVPHQPKSSTAQKLMAKLDAVLDAVVTASTAASETKAKAARKPVGAKGTGKKTKTVSAAAGAKKTKKKSSAGVKTTAHGPGKVLGIKLNGNLLFKGVISAQKPRKKRRQGRASR